MLLKCLPFQLWLICTSTKEPEMLVEAAELNQC